MKKCFPISLSVLSLLLVAGIVSAQEPTPAPSAAVPAAGGTNSVASTNQLPVYKFKSTKVFASGIDMGSFVTIKTPVECVGVHILGGCRVVSENDGRQLLVYVNDAAKNWIKFEFITEDVPSQVNVDSAFPFVSKYFGTLPTTRSQTAVFGKPSVVFSAKGGQAGAEKDIRAQVIQCKTGILVVSTMAYGSNAPNVIFTMQRLVSSLQSADTEKGLIVPKPVPES